MQPVSHSRPVMFRAIQPDGSHGAVHTAQKFVGGPAPSRAFCGAPTAGITSPFRGMGDVTCPVCDDAVVRMADAQDSD